MTTVSANDVDTNPALTYTFVDETTNQDETAAFSIDRFSGKIILKKRLDYESKQEYQLKIAVSDSAHVAHTTLTIRVTDVNDNAPVFQQPAYHVSLPGKWLSLWRNRTELTFMFVLQTKSVTRIWKS